MIIAFKDLRLPSAGCLSSYSASSGAALCACASGIVVLDAVVVANVLVSLCLYVLFVQLNLVIDLLDFHSKILLY